MKVIKLDAIPSTNDFLKQLSRFQIVENFTTVCANNQTNGKGQMGAVWQSEIGKNLIMSVFVKDVLFKSAKIFELNIAVSMAIISVLKTLKIPNLSIKWPNDIMSDAKKIGGILIENTFKTDKSIESIVGIGLNVNQIDFSGLPKASSMGFIMNQNFEIESILNDIVKQLETNCMSILNGEFENLRNKYYNSLFKVNVPMVFETPNNLKFMGIIKGVNFDGLLQVELEDDTVQQFGIKEISMLF